MHFGVRDMFGEWVALYGDRADSYSLQRNIRSYRGLFQDLYRFKLHLLKAQPCRGHLFVSHTPPHT